MPATRTPWKAGETFGSWTLVEYIASTSKPRTNSKWVCRCSCGVLRDVRVDHLRSGASTSCGHDLPGKKAEGIRHHHIRKGLAQPEGADQPASPWAVLRRFGYEVDA